ncbi:MAG TPA: GGDEF domain-containing protein [Telluria sp.]|nr:GGDEF domain-containing protein [Telluria sp.]
MDIKTLLFALALGNLTLCAALFFYKYEQPKSPAMSVWALSKQLQAGAWLLLFFYGSGVLPPLATVLGGYLLLFAGLAAEAGALWQAADRQGWRRRMLPALALGSVLFAVCYFVDEVGLRTVIGALVMSALYFSGAAALAVDWRTASMLRRFLAIATGLLAALVALRGVLVVLMPEGWGWVSSSLLQVLSSGAFYLLMLLNGFGYLLLARERHQDELARLAVVDTLLDVPNRRGFFNALAPWMALARRPGLPTALMVFDVDQFKRINDAYGHPAGDVVLRTVIDTCRKQLRDSDQIGRLVGVEFAVLLPRTQLHDALTVAERMRAAVEATPIKTGRALVNMTLSIGVTTIRPDDSTVSLFKRVDEALQTAKLGGRNRVVEAAPPIPAETAA